MAQFCSSPLNPHLGGCAAKKQIPISDKGLISWGGHIRAGFDFTESFWDGVGVYYRRSREVELTEVFTSSGYGFSVDTNSTKPIAAGIGGDMGNFFNFDRQSIGKQRGVSLMSTVRPQSNFTITFDGSYAQSLDEQRIIDGRFFVSSLRVTYLFSRDSFLRVFTQAGPGTHLLQPEYTNRRKLPRQCPIRLGI